MLSDFHCQLFVPYVTIFMESRFEEFQEFFLFLFPGGEGQVRKRKGEGTEGQQGPKYLKGP